MKKFYILSVLYLLFSVTGNKLFAQAGMKWAKAFQGGGDEYGYSIAVDANGNVYTTGTFSSTVDFDPGPGVFNLNTKGGFDAFVSKLDKDGNFVWARAMGGQSSRDQGLAIVVDDKENVYTTGTFTDGADFDPGPGICEFTTNSLNHDTYISKLNANGDFVWAKQLSGLPGTYTTVWSIALDGKGNVYTTGELLGTTDFDPGPGTHLLTASFSNIFISKLNGSGNFVWAKLLGGEGIWGSNNGQSIAIDKTGNIYTAGYFIGPSDFDPDSTVFTLNSKGDFDIFISKLNADGKFLWAKAIGGKGDDRGFGMALDKNNSVYTTGIFSDTADFDPGAGTFNMISKGNWDVFISKIDSLGNFVWAKPLSGRFYERGYEVAVDQLGNTYTTGYFSDTVDFDPSPAIFNLNTLADWDYNVFISKLDASGNFIWAKQFAQAKEATTGNTFCYGHSIAVDNQENVYTTGEFTGLIDFDPGYNVFKIQAYKDAFIHKISPCQLTTGTDIRSACNSFVWLDGKTYTQNNTSALFTIENAAGCDSILTLSLSIYKVDTSVTLSSNTLTANATGVNYRWLDCLNGYAFIPGEINKSYTPAFNGSFAVEILTAACSDTSSCYQLITTNINEPEIEPAWKISPNPNNGCFIISTNESISPVHIRVLNPLGELLQESVITAAEERIDLIHPSGIYFVEIITATKKRQWLKVIKK